MGALLTALTTEVSAEQTELTAAGSVLVAATNAERAARAAITSQIATIEEVEGELADLRTQLLTAATADLPALQADIEIRELELSDARGQLVDRQREAQRVVESKARASERVNRATQRKADLQRLHDEAVELEKRDQEITDSLEAPDVVAYAAALAGADNDLDAVVTALKAVVPDVLVDLALERRKLENLRRENARTLFDTAIDRLNQSARVKHGIARETAEAQTQYERARRDAGNFASAVISNLDGVGAFLSDTMPPLSQAVSDALTAAEAEQINIDAADAALELVQLSQVLEDRTLALEQVRLQKQVTPSTTTTTQETNYGAAATDHNDAIGVLDPQQDALEEYEAMIPVPMRAYLLRLGDARDTVERLRAKTIAQHTTALSSTATGLANALTEAAAKQRRYDALEAEAAALAVRKNAFDEGFRVFALAASRGDVGGLGTVPLVLP